MTGGEIEQLLSEATRRNPDTLRIEVSAHPGGWILDVYYSGGPRPSHYQTRILSDDTYPQAHQALWNAVYPSGIGRPAERVS